uniref:Secreted protein n=1 Tax=Haemonchus contortus TaxID=6289 RepID=A0A7I4YM72_HAECO
MVTGVMDFVYKWTWSTHHTLYLVSLGRSKGAKESRDRHKIDRHTTVRHTTDRQAGRQTDRYTDRQT